MEEIGGARSAESEQSPKTCLHYRTKLNNLRGVFYAFSPGLLFFVEQIQSLDTLGEHPRELGIIIPEGDFIAGRRSA
jgi:hypothetical protein